MEEKILNMMHTIDGDKVVRAFNKVCPIVFCLCGFFSFSFAVLGYVNGRLYIKDHEEKSRNEKIMVPVTCGFIGGFVGLTTPIFAILWPISLSKLFMGSDLVNLALISGLYAVFKK
jgi:hypothetical protein